MIYEWNPAIFKSGRANTCLGGSPLVNPMVIVSQPTGENKIVEIHCNLTLEEAAQIFGGG